jgi:hypothetical protein
MNIACLRGAPLLHIPAFCMYILPWPLHVALDPHKARVDAESFQLRGLPEDWQLCLQAHVLV